MNTSVNENSKPTEEQKHPGFLIGIRHKGQDKSDKFDPGKLNLRVGMQVMVESGKGEKFGTVASNKIINLHKIPKEKLKRVLRIANEKDIQTYNNLRDREIRATELCLSLIKKLKLTMNLSRVVYFPEINKSVFFFTAEGRVDFRQLVKELASNLRHRIEMRQVGVRDEAKAITGIGICGETLCCSTFLTEFTPVTIRMAKDQGLALNPSKISGVCGRLMCCLQYEHDIYKKLIKGMPKSGGKINTPDGAGRVLKNDILQQNILVRLDDESIMTYHLDELKDYLKPNKPRSN